MNEKGICNLCGHDPACGVLAIYHGEFYCHTDDHSCYIQAHNVEAEGL